MKINDTKLPLKKGDKVGTINVYEKNKLVTTGELISNTNVDKLSYLELCKEMLKNSILGIIK